jgi:hypothetical protein
MYYTAKDPVPLSGEKREMPVIETMPVTEGTPVFRNFYFNHIFCQGAEKGIFFRGIPEMNIKNVVLSNMVLTCKKGIECTEASGINFNNIRLITAESNPLIYIQNSSNLQFNQIVADRPIDLFFSINGDRSNKIQVSKTDFSQTKNKVAFSFGAAASAIDLK